MGVYAPSGISVCRETPPDYDVPLWLEASELPDAGDGAVASVGPLRLRDRLFYGGGRGEADVARHRWIRSARHEDLARVLEALEGVALVVQRAEGQAPRALAEIWSLVFLAQAKRSHIEYRISVLVG